MRWIIGLAVAVVLVPLGLATATAAGAAPGVGWASQTVPSGVGPLFGISCPVTTQCVAVAETGDGDGNGAISAIGTSDGGSTWSALHVPIGSYYAVSCADVNHCVAVGAGSPSANAGAEGPIIATDDGGATWSQVFTATNGFLGNSVSCQGTTCLAVGGSATPNGVVASTDSGQDWTDEAGPAALTAPTAVSCADAADCWIAGLSTASAPTVVSTSDGGQTWSSAETLASIPGGGGLSAYTAIAVDFPDAMDGFVLLSAGMNACTTTSSTCGDVVESTNDGGVTWAISYNAPQGSDFSAISCFDSQHCALVGDFSGSGVLDSTTDGGASWNNDDTLPNQLMSAVSCSSDTTCEGAGTNAGESSGINGGVVATTSLGQGSSSTPPPTACTPGSENPAPTGPIVRISGPDRDATAVAVSNSTFPGAGSAKSVVLASDANYPDALAGTPLAVANDGPLLLAPPSGLTPTVSAEITRVLPPGGTVYILGGDAALSSAVEGEVSALGDTPMRIAGPDRFATAVAIAGALGDPRTVLEATGTDFPDALSAGAAAARAGGVVLLTDGITQAPETAAYLSAYPGGEVTAIGGPAAAADPTATALAGADRYATAVLVAQHFFSAPKSIGFASGLAFPDALSGGAAVGIGGGPMLLVPPCGALPSSLTSYLPSVQASIGTGALFGGPDAVGDDVLGELEPST